MIRRALAPFASLVILLAGMGLVPQGWAQDTPAVGYNGEYIDSYQTTIDIQPDGSLNIREIIKVYVKGDKIERGIFRDFSRQGLEAYQPSSPPISGLFVTKDGEPENIARLEYVSGAYRAYFGQENVKLKKNRFYTWKIHYSVARAIRQFDETDNFDWNVMGHGWAFPVREWQVAVNFPDAAQLVDAKVFSGPFGFEGNAANVKVDRTATGVLLTGVPLDAYEGVTFVQRFTADLIEASPTYPVLNEAYYAELRRQEEARQERLRAEAEALLAEAREEIEFNLAGSLSLLIAVTMIGGVALFIWFQIGREKATMPVVIPLFYPPNHIGPAAARYLFRRGHANRDRLLITGLVSLAVKGAIELTKDRIERINAKESNLTPAEIGILGDLNLQFTNSAFSLKNPSDNKAKIMRKAGNNLKKRFRDEFRQNFRPNWIWMIVLLLAVPVIWATGVAVTAFYVMAIYALMVILLLLASLILLRSGQNTFDFRSLVFFALAFGGLGLALSWITLSGHAGLLPLHAAYMISAVMLFFVRVHINNYSSAGAETAAELEGLKMYIRSAERGTLKDEPEPDFKHFSDIYPYAFALGLHTVWAQRFEKDLARWLAEDNSDYVYWYGTSYHGFEDTLDRFESSVSKAANYSSSSGSGGSSFSGGGGGGGGGGGW